MAVYVDRRMIRGPRGMLMSHMWADTLDELLAMADTIGVARKWLQQPPRASWVHFDISRTKAELAEKHGAIVTDNLAALRHRAVLDGDTALVAQIDEKRSKIDCWITHGL